MLRRISRCSDEYLGDRTDIWINVGEIIWELGRISMCCVSCDK